MAVSKYKNPNFESTENFFNCVSYKTWGVFFPETNDVLKEVSSADAVTLAFDLGLVPNKEEIAQMEVKCTCNDVRGIMVAVLDCSKCFGFRIRCAVSLSRSQERQKIKNLKRKLPDELKLECTKEVSATFQTWFQNHKISIVDHFFLIFLWCCRATVSDAITHSRCSPNTAVDFYSYCREVTEIIISNRADMLQIGGEGLYVEVDETYLNQRKYHKGKKLSGESICIFGIYCRETKDGLFMKVKNKSRAVLWSQMARYIAPGSIICSDGAAMYLNCTSMGFQEHLKVNHSIEFVNSENTTAHTNNIEIRNRYVKDAIKSHRTDRALASYMSEYWYRTLFFKNQDQNWMSPGKNYERFLNDVKLCYPGFGKKGLELIEIGVCEEDMAKLNPENSAAFILQGPREDNTEADHSDEY